MTNTKVSTVKQPGGVVSLFKSDLSERLMIAILRAVSMSLVARLLRYIIMAIAVVCALFLILSNIAIYNGLIPKQDIRDIWAIILIASGAILWLQLYAEKVVKRYDLNN